VADLYPKQYLYRRVVRAKLYIDENFARPIDLNAISDEACFSKFHFMRLFKEIYGWTPHQYLTHVRVERAKRFLAAGETVAKACFDVGFDSISSFTGLFKRRTGMTPAAYQADRLRVQDEIAGRPLKHIPGCFAEKKGWRENSNFGEVKSIDGQGAGAE
jgi:AraC-like DNA-binding protein